MSRKYKFRDSEGLYFISFSVINWIDLFIRNEYKHILIESLNYCTKHKGLKVYAWVIMTSHVHLIIGSSKEKPEGIVRDFKSFSSRKLKELIENHSGESRKGWMLWMMKRAGTKNKNNKGWQLWQQNNQPIELVTNFMIEQKLEYLHNNPVEAGFVAEAADWKYSSALDYTGVKGYVDMELLE